MQRNHWAVAPSTASPQERHSKHWIFPLLQAAQAHLTCDGNKGTRVRYSSVRRNKPYSSNKKHLPQLQQHVFTGESSKQKCRKDLDIAEVAEKKGYEKNQRNTDDIYFDATDSTVSTER